jgi:hypothetical protein
MAQVIPRGLRDRNVTNVEGVEPNPREVPPPDPDDWSDEQWIEWLNATDGEAATTSSIAPATTAGRIVHSTGGRAIGQTMMGLASALYGPRTDRPPIVVQANSDPEEEPHVTLHLDPEHPERSFVIFRSASPPEP